MGEGHFEAAGGAGHRDLHRVTVPEAARILGVTESAVRKRVQRGHMPHDKEEGGRVYVYISPEESRSPSAKVQESHAHQSRSSSPELSRDAYARSLEERVAFLEEQVRRQTLIIAGLVRRVPELEAPPEPRGSPQTAAAGPGGSGERPPTEEAQEGPERRPWWRRWFGFD